MQHPNPLHQQQAARNQTPDTDRDPHRGRLRVSDEEQHGPEADLDGAEDDPADRPTMPGVFLDLERPHQPQTPGRHRRQSDDADKTPMAGDRHEG